MTLLPSSFTRHFQTSAHGLLRDAWPFTRRITAIVSTTLGLGVSLAAASFTAQAQAQSFPTKPIRWVVVAPAG
jgi:hypothetical protein